MITGSVPNQHETACTIHCTDCHETALARSLQAVERISALSWVQDTADSLKVGTMMATLLPQWLKPDNVPEPHPPNWRMDQVFRPVWTDEAKTEGRLEFIPTNERSIGRRSYSRYHHAFVREDQAFEPRMVLAAVDLAITQVRAQLAEKKRQNEEREPPPPVDHPPVNNNFPT
ncbi:hypothetical protein F5H01DRAFT_416299 [Linnemannia elongata]|nr:hypothetical protein F5H01DRAFT_416299 [Linnemannia elongata]